MQIRPLLAWASGVALIIEYLTNYLLELVNMQRLKALLAKKQTKFGIIGAIVLLLLLVQLAPIDKSNPPVKRELVWDSPQTQALVEAACFDCHSNETVWPWYADIGPTRLLVRRHVLEGREELNFSTLGDAYEFEEIAEVINEGEMPPWDYVLLHPDAQLDDDEKAQVIAGLEATFIMSDISISEDDD